MESALIKYICGKDGSVSWSDLLAVFPHDNYPTESLQDVTLNQERFHLAFLDGQRKVIAKTKLRLCKAKDCRGCRNLHLCKQFLFGHCRFENDRQKGCYFGHEIFSEQNLRALRAHGLEDLDQTELCTLLLQNDNLLLPSVCHSYNNGVGEHGGCVDGDECKRLHICERYLRMRCTCSLHAHDFYEPHPRKTLLDSGVPSHILASIRAVYMNVEALRRSYREGRGGHQPGVHHAAMSHSNQGKTEVCPFFAKGSCKYGDKCFKDHSRYPSRQGRNERRPSNSRQGRDERRQSNSRQGSDERQRSNSRQGSDERQQSNSRQGSDERQQSNSSASDLTRHEDWESFLESSIPTTLQPEDKRVYPPAAAGADTMETWLKRWRENSDKEPMVESEGETMKAQMMALFEELQEARRKLREGEEAKANLVDRDHSIDRSPQLLNDHNQLNEQRADREVSKEVVDDLRTRLASAEQALVAKQQKIDTLMQEMNAFEVQAEVYASDFYSERAAREKIHEEKERLSAQLDCLKKQNEQLLRDMDSLGRQSLVDMRKRHSSQGGASASLFRGVHVSDGDSRISQQKENIQGHACPMCAEIMPDLDSLEIHVIDCNP